MTTLEFAIVLGFASIAFEVLAMVMAPLVAQCAAPVLMVLVAWAFARADRA